MIHVLFAYPNEMTPKGNPTYLKVFKDYTTYIEWYNGNKDRVYIVQVTRH
jgi:hypothetical protein